MSAPPPALALSEVFRLSPNAYMVLDRGLCFVAANEAYLRLTASTLEGLIGRPIFELFPHDPDDPSNASAMLLRGSFERVLRTGQTDVLALIPYRVPLETPTGTVTEERFWSATHTPLHAPSGEVAFILQHTVDITELERLKQENATLSSQMQSDVLRRARRVQDENRILEDERRRLMHLFDQAPSLMSFMRGPEHVFEMANTAYTKLVGERPLLGLPVREALPEVVAQGFVALLDRVYRTGIPHVGRGVRVALQRTPGGPLEDMYVDFMYQPIRDVTGAIVGIFTQGHDITEQKVAEAALREREKELSLLNDQLELRVKERTAELADANRELESFSSSVSHDLRAPLRHITGFAQLLERRAKDRLDAESLGFLHTISDAAKEGGKLVDDLLAFSRMGRASMKRGEVDLDQLVGDVRRELENDAEVAGRTVHWDIGPLPPVLADPSLLRLALKNLLANALKYTRTRAEAHIAIGAAREDTLVHLWVRDDGVGFDMRYVDKLFGVFQRLHSAAEFEGTGIGLANVRRIVGRHGGSVWAEGAVNCGATFHLTLPAVPTHERA
ncbi:MAG: PAS domain-containing protein [Polyangiales bacterium]